MNVYRRFAPEHRAKMVEYYEKVLALRPLQPINLGGGTQMILFGIGTGQIKLASGLKQGREYHLGGVNEATGIRVFTLFFPDEAAVSSRLQTIGYPAPSFKDNGNGTRAALVQDPGRLHAAAGRRTECAGGLVRPGGSRNQRVQISKTAARSIASSSASTNCPRCKDADARRDEVSISATARRRSTSGRPGRTCRPTPGAPASSTW